MKWSFIIITGLCSNVKIAISDNTHNELWKKVKIWYHIHEFFKTSVFHILVFDIDLRFYYYHWVGTSADGLLVPDIIRPVVNASAQTWFIRYIYILLQFTVPN